MASVRLKGHDGYRDAIFEIPAVAAGKHCLQTVCLTGKLTVPPQENTPRHSYPATINGYASSRQHGERRSTCRTLRKKQPAECFRTGPAVHLYRTK